MNNLAFGPLLKSWRAARRLSQLDLALETNISQRHLSFMESGRAQPSRQMVLALAESLDVPLRERNVLLISAGFAPLYRESTLDEPAMAQIRKALELTLRHHEPYPALVLNRDWRLVMANEAAQRLFALFIDLEAVWAHVGDGGIPNVLTLMFHQQGLRPYVQNLAEIAPSILVRIRREAQASPVDQATIDLVDRLEATLVEVQASTSPPPDWQPPPLVSIELAKDDIRLALFTMITTFGTPQDITMQELRLETLFPADKTTEKLLKKLANFT